MSWWNRGKDDHSGDAPRYLDCYARELIAPARAGSYAMTRDSGDPSQGRIDAEVERILRDYK